MGSNSSTHDVYQYESLDNLASKYKGDSGCLGSAPLRLARLCCLGILLPILCIVIPVYARYVLYADTSLVLSASDMRLLDSHMSTAWCQKQVLRMNRSFDAYLLEEPPTLASKPQTISMVRSFEIDDDLKEYWGFYLLRGSEITVSSCARYLGANVMLIKGRGGLRYCAYVGEESGEGQDSVEEDVEIKKLETQLRISTNNLEKFKAPPPPMFKQHNKKDQSRILELLKARNEKRKLIKLLEKEAHLRNYNETSDAESAGIIQKVDNALRKMLEKEIQALYHEIKSILYGPKTSPAKNKVAAILEQHSPRNRTRDQFQLPVMPDSENLSDFLGAQVDDEENGGFEVTDNAAASFNATSDGIAEDRGTIDHRHVNDTSESHEESSFSSSEEAMLHCRGVLLSHPLIPESHCSNLSDPHQNTVRYTVNEDGYYYFIFSSANEKFPNQITVKFELQKTVYNTSGASSSCHNATTCEFPLSFASDELVVLSMPVPESNYSKLWDETFIVESACEPRMPLYLAFCLALPVLILLCAFR